MFSRQAKPPQPYALKVANWYFDFIISPLSLFFSNTPSRIFSSNRQGEVRVFRSYENHHVDYYITSHEIAAYSKDGVNSAIPTWKIGRAITANPNYFTPYEIDGAWFEDCTPLEHNPTAFAYQETVSLHKTKPKLICSIGTGKHDEKDRQVSKSSFAKYLYHPDSDILLAKASRGVSFNVRDRSKVDSVPYYRFASRVPVVPRNEWSPGGGKRHRPWNQTMDHMKQVTRRYLESIEQFGIEEEDMLQCAWNLVAVRRERAMTERWEQFASDFGYICPTPDCTSKSYRTREDLRRHGREAHSMLVRGAKDEVACVFGGCAFDDLPIFPTREMYKEHLHSCHGIRDPYFVSRLEYENWLDLGRVRKDNRFG